MCVVVWCVLCLCFDCGVFVLLLLLLLLHAGVNRLFRVVCCVRVLGLLIACVACVLHCFLFGLLFAFCMCCCLIDMIVLLCIVVWWCV